MLYSEGSLAGWMDERLQVKIDVDYEAETLVIHQPRRYGGRQEMGLERYNQFEGSMVQFIRAGRAWNWQEELE